MLMAIRQLSFYYGRQAVLQDVSVDLKAGEVVALIGANGSGKTTLMQLMLGDLQPARGEIAIDASLHVANSIAYVPDKPPLYPDWSVREFLLRLANERNINAEAVNDVVRCCSLESVQNKQCRALSHGYRQRVSLAQALLHDPKLLFMDEPMNGLDDTQRKALRSVTEGLAAKGITVLLSMHDLVDVTAMARRVWCLREGRLFDVLIPEYAGVVMWAVFSSPDAAQVYACAAREGRVCGFLSNELEYHGTRLLADPALQSLERQYPPAALLARMEGNYG